MMTNQEKEIIQLAAKAGASKAMEVIEKERARFRKDKKDWRLRNTRLLLEHYQEFKLHAKNSFYDIKKAIESANQEAANYTEEISAKKDLYVESVMISSGRTGALMEDVDRMLNLYKLQCSEGLPEYQRRYRIIQNKYLIENKLTILEIAEKEHLDKSTIYRDIENAVFDLSVLIFGIDIFYDIFY